MKKIISDSPSRTKEIGKNLARKILKKENPKEATVISLEGDFGGGKTTFAKGFAKGLSIRQRIKSPTFVIMRRYKVKQKSLKNLSFYHLDCYRIKSEKEVLDLGLKEIFKEPKNIVLIEWGEKIRKILPKKTIHIKFDFVDKKTRKIKMTNNPKI